jgi:hypothetical protein
MQVMYELSLGEQPVNERPRKRFVISDKWTGDYLATVFADRFERVPDTVFGHFYVGDEVVGTAEIGRVTVADSGGRVAA